MRGSGTASALRSAFDAPSRFHCLSKSASWLKLCGISLLIREGWLYSLWCTGAGLKQKLLPLAFFLRAHNIGSDCFLAGHCRCNLRIRLIDSHKGSVDPRILKFALASIVLDRRLSRLHLRTRLRYLCQVVAILQFGNRVSLAHLLEVGNPDIPNDASDLCAKRRKVSTHVSVIRYLLASTTFPSIPVPSDRDYQSSRKQQHQRGGGILLPFRPRGRCGNVLQLSCGHRSPCGDGRSSHW